VRTEDNLRWLGGQHTRPCVGDLDLILHRVANGLLLLSTSTSTQVAVLL